MKEGEGMFRATGWRPPGPHGLLRAAGVPGALGGRTIAVIHLAGVGSGATARQAELTVSDKRNFSQPRPLGCNYEKTAGVGGREGTLGGR